MIKNINKYQLLTPLQCAKMHSIDSCVQLHECVVGGQSSPCSFFTFYISKKCKKQKQKNNSSFICFLCSFNSKMSDCVCPLDYCCSVIIECSTFAND